MEARLAAAAGLLFLLSAVFFVADPASWEAPGSVPYWMALASGYAARPAFLLCFSIGNICALCVLEHLRSIEERQGIARYSLFLMELCLIVAIISYTRILGGEAQRARAYLNGNEDVRSAIVSTSLSLDPGGWLVFLAFGLSIAGWSAVNMNASRGESWTPTVGLLLALFYLSAFIAIQFGIPKLLVVSAAVGGGLVAPLWWIMLARDLAQGARPRV